MDGWMDGWMDGHVPRSRVDPKTFWSSLVVQFQRSLRNWYWHCWMPYDVHNNSNNNNNKKKPNKKQTTLATINRMESNVNNNRVQSRVGDAIKLSSFVLLATLISSLYFLLFFFFFFFFFFLFFLEVFHPGWPRRDNGDSIRNQLMANLRRANELSNMAAVLFFFFFLFFLFFPFFVFFFLF